MGLRPGLSDLNRGCRCPAAGPGYAPVQRWPELARRTARPAARAPRLGPHHRYRSRAGSKTPSAVTRNPGGSSVEKSKCRTSRCAPVRAQSLHERSTDPVFAVSDDLTLYFQSMTVGRIRHPTFRTRSWSGAFTPTLPRRNATADRVKDYILAAQLFAAQLHLADGGHAAPPAGDALHTFVDLLWSTEWCVVAADGRVMSLTGGPFFYPDGLVTWSEQLASAVG